MFRVVSLRTPLQAWRPLPRTQSMIGGRTLRGGEFRPLKRTLHLGAGGDVWETCAGECEHET
jgi:hypothetical protein